MAFQKNRLGLKSAKRESTFGSSSREDLTNLAANTWLQARALRTLTDEAVLEQIWQMMEADRFSHFALAALEGLQVVERQLWPTYHDGVTDRHVLLLALAVNVKIRENIISWDLFESQPADFSSFFRRVLRLVLDRELTYDLRSHLVCFLIGTFSALDNGLVRKECAPLVSAAILHNIHSDDARSRLLERFPLLKKAYRASVKRLETADQDTKARLLFDRSWLYNFVLSFFADLFKSQSSQDAPGALVFCERVIELLVDLESQIPTRRHLTSLLRDTNVLALIRMSPYYRDPSNKIIRDLTALLEHYFYFPIDDQTGTKISDEEAYRIHCSRLSDLQATALQLMPDQLKLLILSNFAALSSPDEFMEHMQDVGDDELRQLCTHLNLRLNYPSSSNVPTDRQFVLSVLVTSFERPCPFRDGVRRLRVCPTEKELYASVLTRTDAWDGSRPLAVPKLNLQYLTIGDFLWRSFILHRHEAFYAIRNHLELVTKRMRPQTTSTGCKFSGSSPMALPVGKLAVAEVQPSNVGETVPAKVVAEVSIDVYSLLPRLRGEWESLRADDVVFFLVAGSGDDDTNPIKHVRTAEVIHVSDGNGRILSDDRFKRDTGTVRRRELRIVVKLDPHAYQADSKANSKQPLAVYNDINLIVRRRSRENNFKPVLESIQKLTLSDVPLPSWLTDVFLGYGDPASAHYTRLPSRLSKIDMGDTFVDWNHLTGSLPGRSVNSAHGELITKPPFVLEFDESSPEDETKQSKKRRRDHNDDPQLIPESVTVSTYTRENTGPYPTDLPSLNTVRFTQMQVDAIISGSQPGLTLVIGPPGTGKTDIAAQTINTIYHNFPSQRTLLIAHSNQALNQLFHKIAALDIDERHLLRLGHGEDELEMDGSFSKHGRVESFLELGQRYLADVARLAASLEAPGAHGASCETADYFNQVYVKPTWQRYWDMVKSDESTPTDIITQFPFPAYFSTAPQPLFPVECSRVEVVEIAVGCYKHIQKIFSELESVRPFEILRNPRERANYLLVREARIIAMTSTHAAMRRQEIVALGFEYDNVVIEEAAQMTEIETFIPLALQKPRKGDLPVQRVFLCGDHLQNSPIIQNNVLRQYARLDQTLFHRLVRRGVPTVTLDQQGRARPSIASLYKWRYSRLGNLPLVESASEFLHANPGFRYDFQFIDVPDYNGRGEQEPTPHFVQNLGEAEYAVAIYMYMRLLGYPAAKISILVTYAGQKALVRDVLMHRCAKSPLFGMPRIVSTVDKYQGEQNDYVILSLVRTSRVGYLRDVRRLTVALSRARLGLYVLGRRAVFEAALEMKPAFDLMFSRPTKLTLVAEEKYPTSRLMVDRRPASSRPDADGGSNGNVNGDVGSSLPVVGMDDSAGNIEIDGVEQMGKYVFEMTQSRLGNGVPEQESVLIDQMDSDMQDADSDVDI